MPFLQAAGMAAKTDKTSKVQRPAAKKRLPPNAGKGRKKGVRNKMTRELKDMILHALDGAGGVEYLQRQADQNPSAFLSLVGKVLPMTVANADGSNLQAPQFVVMPVQPVDRDG